MEWERIPFMVLMGQPSGWMPGVVRQIGCSFRNLGFEETSKEHSTDNGMEKDDTYACEMKLVCWQI